jgi:hypothetical protein
LLRRAVPIRYDGQTTSGRTEPLRVAVECDDGTEHDVVLKLSAGPECSVEGLANEALGALLAADLGLPVNEPFLVDLDSSFIESVPNEHVQGRLRQSNPVAFGSTFAGPQWRKWNSTNKLLPSQELTALATMAFDAFCANNDRSPSNPNLLVNGLEWRLIDHEGAFGFRMKIFPKCHPWEPGNLNMIAARGQQSEHLFFRFFSGREPVDLSFLRLSWSTLSDARLSQYDASLPEEWDAVRPIFGEAITHLSTVRAKIEDCLCELQRVLR